MRSNVSSRSDASTERAEPDSRGAGRRYFLIASGMALAGAVVSLPGCAARKPLPRGGPLQAADPLKLGKRRFASGSPTSVRIVGYDHERAVADDAVYAEAFAAAMDCEAARKVRDRIQRDIRDGRKLRALVKPAVNTGKLYPSTSSPASVRHVCRWLRALGVSEVIVADKSGWASDAARNMRHCGIARAALDGGAEMVMAFDQLPEEDRWRTYEVPEATTWKGRFELSSLLSRVDYLISVPRLSTHLMTGYTIAIKNWQGLASMRSRGYAHVRRARRLSRCLAEYSLAVKPDLVVTDGGLLLTTAGPDRGLVLPGNILMVSEDVVATDVVGLSVMRDACQSVDRKTDRKLRMRVLEDESESVWSVPMVRRAVDLEIGVTGPDQIVIDAQSVPDDRLGSLRKSIDKPAHRVSRDS